MNSKKFIESLIYFLKLGSTGFGGPVALAAIMQSELVEKRKWISVQEFQQAFPLIKAMPGPLAFQTAVYLAYRYNGFLTALASGIGLVLPAAIMMVVLAIYAPEMASNQAVQSTLVGFQGGALALIALACYQLAKPYEKQKMFWIFVVLTIVLTVFKIPEPLLIVFFGAVAVFLPRFKSHLKLRSVPLLELTFIGLVAGSFVFGTGLAALPWLEKKFVYDHQWISHAEFLQAVAFGQMTPGPVLVTVTYLGYKISGLLGGVVATVAIFLPGLIHMTTWFPRAVQSLSKKPWIQLFTFGAISAVVGTLFVIVLKLLPEIPTFGIVIFLIALLVTFLFKKFPAWLLILCSGGLGYLTSIFQAS